MNMSAVVDESKSLNQGALLLKGFEIDGWWWSTYVRSGLFDPDKPIRKYSATERANLFDLDDGRKIKVDKIHLTYLGLRPKLKQSLGSKDPETLQPMSGSNTIASSRAGSAPPAKARGSRQRLWRAGFQRGISPNSRPCR